MNIISTVCYFEKKCAKKYQRITTIIFFRFLTKKIVEDFFFQIGARRDGKVENEILYSIDFFYFCRVDFDECCVLENSHFPDDPTLVVRKCLTLIFYLKRSARRNLKICNPALKAWEISFSNQSSMTQNNNRHFTQQLNSYFPPSHIKR